MKRNIIKMIFTILTLLLSSGIVYSQTDFWERASVPPGTWVFSVVFASNGNIWVGASNLETSLDGVYLSTDNGDTWVEKNNDLSGDINSAMAINPING